MRDYMAIAEQYVDDVLSGRRVAGKLEKMACQRHRADLQRAKTDPDFDYRLDADRAHHVCYFVETMPHVKGRLAKVQPDGTRQRLIMEPWQVFATVSMFGWINADGVRRFVYAYIEIAKKNGKSTWAAALALYMAFVDGEAGAEVYAAATGYDQAKIVWQDAKMMVEYSPAFRERFGVSTTQYLIKADYNNSIFKPLSSDKSGTKDGLNVHFAVEDELHAHKDSSMYDIIADGIASREQPMILAITTAGNDRTGVCFRERATVINMLTGKSSIDNYFGLIFTLDDNDDWQDESNWGKANPSLGAALSLTYLRDKYKKVSETPSMEPLFKQKQLNMWVGHVNGWIQLSTWQAALYQIAEKSFVGVPSFGGLDLASRLDLAGWCKMYPRLGNDGRVHWHVFSRQYINSRVIETSSAINGEKRPDAYHEWAAAGWLTVTEGNSTDFDQIERDILESHAESPLYEIGYDPHNGHQLAQHLINAGISLVEIRQVWQYTNPAMRWLEVLLADGRLHHNGDPVLEWCITNVVVKPDNNQNIFPLKSAPAKKIDAALALIMAAARAMFYDDPSVFDLTPDSDAGDMDDFLSDIAGIRR